MPETAFVWAGFTYPDYAAYIKSVTLAAKVSQLRVILRDFEDELAGLRHEATSEEKEAQLVRWQSEPKVNP